jgi:hypothetical protein
MPWTAFFSSAKKISSKKAEFFKEVKQYIGKNCKNTYVAAFMFYYAASSDASIYSGMACTTKGKTYDKFVEEGNKYISTDPFSRKQATEMDDIARIKP